MSSVITCKWLRKAGNDLRSAELLLENGLTGESTFHSQQAAEKALKALITALGEQPPKTHNITRLLQVIEERGIDTSKLGGRGVERLTVYAVEARYPDFEEEPTEEEAREALGLARAVVEWVIEKLGELGVEC